ncbi:hypothetical protein J437_LFUL016572 [Ladona fulva]|uniref:Uncharacterized protein n=1 Tax=Ladona fulva TaxID=123851 RepID=A0A8K0KV08_LADFU|nr:hypothetical protein J437_LFUL016572 [Ladona fulva]
MLLEDKNKVGIIKLELERKIGWDHYEFLPQKQCQGMFHCPNGSCIIPSKVPPQDL